MENRISGLADKVDIIENLDEYTEKRKKNIHGIGKNLATPLKDKTYKSLALKKEKRCKLKA
jgi:hypothetical protein